MDGRLPAVAAFFARNAAKLGRRDSALSERRVASSLTDALLQAIAKMNPHPNQRGSRVRRYGGIDSSALAAFILLLAVPVLALCRVASRDNWFIFASVPITASLFTYLAYWRDKRSAEAGERRIPESTLHLVELIGGWPGAFLAQRKFRHKTSKSSYQTAFWIIVMFHQYVALDSFLGWRLAKGAVHLFRAQSA